VVITFLRYNYGMIKTAIVGSTGYSGQELVRLLALRNDVEIKFLSSQSYVGKKYSDIYPFFKGLVSNVCVEQDVLKFAKECDVVFLALPHGIASKEITREVLATGCKIIDLGADFRLKSRAIYEKWYGVEHHGEELLKNAVYGLCELNRDEIKGAQLIANPGCYATCSIMSAAPLLDAGIVRADNIIIDAKSGVSGAGRTLTADSLYCECNENIKAYKLASHRHTPEIEQALGVDALMFTPHLIPVNRGILATSYYELTHKVNVDEAKRIYKEFYKDCYFVRVIEGDESAEIKNVKGTNFFDVNVFMDERTNKLIVTAAIDNLVKGAAGQAIQNMNLMFGLDEKTGLEATGVYL